MSLATAHTDRPTTAPIRQTRRSAAAALLLGLIVLTLGAAGCAPRTRAAAAEPAPTPTRTTIVATVDGSTRRGEAAPRPANPAPTRSAPNRAPDRNQESPARSDDLVFPLAVTIDNHPASRPQSGLAQADVVYEALAEGGVTRFLALYLNGTADKIGPVRSARHYFVYMAAEFNASLVHIGSSPHGYAVQNAVKIRDIDETFGHPGFTRVRERAAPHNAYTSTEAARAALRQVRGEPTPGSRAGLRFKAASDVNPAGREARGLNVEYPIGPYGVRFDYDSTTNRYPRVMASAPHVDANGGQQLAPSNVVVLTIPSFRIDDVGRLELEQTGNGKALVLLDGVAIEGTWSKAGETAPTRLLDSAGRPILLNEGQTWIQVVPSEATVTLTDS